VTKHVIKTAQFLYQFKSDLVKLRFVTTHSIWQIAFNAATKQDASVYCPAYFNYLLGFPARLAHN
jgi:hypothetical protein